MSTIFGRSASVCLAPLAAIVLTSVVMTSAHAACYGPRAQLSPSDVSKFVGDPEGAMNQSPQGGGRFLTQVRDMAASDPATLPAIARLVSKANKDQKFAIGSGLGQAAVICSKTDQTYSAQIQQTILEARDQDLIVAFAAISGDRATTAVGGAGAGAGPGGGIGGQIGALGNIFRFNGTLERIGSDGVNTGQFSYTSSVSGTTNNGGVVNNNGSGSPVSP